MSFLDDMQAKVSDAWSDVTSAGVPAVVAGVESYGSQILADQARANQKQAQAAVSQIASQPGASSGIMASVQGVFKDLATTEGMKHYGPWILLGAVALLIVGKKLL